MKEHARYPVIIATPRVDGSMGAALSELALKKIILRWVTAFHAALYGEAYRESNYIVFPPLPECKLSGEVIEAVPIPEVIPNIVKELKKNRATGTIDVIDCWNGKCHYECTWCKADNGQRICIWGLNLYNWKELGDIHHFEPRGCVGVYWPVSGSHPATATLGTSLTFDIQIKDRLDPFGE